MSEAPELSIVVTIIDGGDCLREFLRAVTACAGLLDQRIVEDGVCLRPISVR